jgi:hypothetical protein
MYSFDYLFSFNAVVLKFNVLVSRTGPTEGRNQNRDLPGVGWTSWLC